MSGDRAHYKVTVTFFIPARTMKEAEHFANLAADSIENRKAVSSVWQVSVEGYDVKRPA